jgi:hypothetical protein
MATIGMDRLYYASITDDDRFYLNKENSLKKSYFSQRDVSNTMFSISPI